jgi:Helix-turn-helix domain
MPADNTTGSHKDKPIVAHARQSLTPNQNQKSDLSQASRILAYLQAGHTLTPLQALRLFDNLSLSQTMTRLKRRGNPIKTKMIRTTSGKRIARYHLEQVKNSQEVT